jgi:hypothetical protein
MGAGSFASRNSKMSSLATKSWSLLNIPSLKHNSIAAFVWVNNSRSQDAPGTASCAHVHIFISPQTDQRI